MLLFSFVDDDTIAVLLSKTKIANWVRSTVLFSDLGGGCEEEDRTTIQTVVREFMEESLNAVRVLKPEMGEQTRPKLEAYLESKNYFCKMSIPSSATTCSIVYLVEVPFQPNVNQVFQAKRLALRRLVMETNKQCLGPAEVDDLVAKHQELEVGQDNKVKIKRVYNEKVALTYFSLDYVDFITKSRQKGEGATYHKRRLSLLHYHRLRIVCALPILQWLLAARKTRSCSFPKRSSLDLSSLEKLRADFINTKTDDKPTRQRIVLSLTKTDLEGDNESRDAYYKKYRRRWG